MQGGSDVRDRVARGEAEIPVEVKGMKVFTLLKMSERQRQYFLSAGALNYGKQSIKILNLL